MTAARSRAGSARPMRPRSRARSRPPSSPAPARPSPSSPPAAPTPASTRWARSPISTLPATGCPSAWPAPSTSTSAPPRSPCWRRARPPPDFHARFSCTGRRYLYRILDRRSPPALERGRVWHVPVALDAERMHVAAQALVGRHDFTSFRSSECQSASPVKTLGGIHVAAQRRADRMPPVGALVPAPPGPQHRRHAEDGGRGQGADRVCARGAGGARSAAAGQTAPAEGLFLEAAV